LGIAARRHQPDLNPKPLEPAGRQTTDCVVTVGGQHDRIARTERDSKDRIDGGHSRRKDDGLAAFENPQGVLPRRPCRVCESGHT
jgi:hypothetical protein